MRVLLAVLAIAGVLVACSGASPDPLATSTGPSYAEQAAPILVCPGPFALIKLMQQSDGVFNEADHNQDNQICQLDVVDPNDGTLVHRTSIDNNVPFKVGSCPQNF